MNDPNMPQPQPPSTDDALGDMERQQEERRGNASLPFQTWSFWISLVSIALGFVLLSGVLPADHSATIAIVGVAQALAHLGYGFRSDAATDKNYKKPAFWGSVVAHVMMFVLGSGATYGPEAQQVIGMVVIGLGYFGYNVRSWVRKKEMVAPGENRFMQKLMQLLFGFMEKQRNG